MYHTGSLRNRFFLRKGAALATAFLLFLTLSRPVRANSVDVAIIKKILPSVVVIYALTNGGGGWIIGTGVIVRPDGLIVTNAHIAYPGNKYTIRLASGKVYKSVKFIGLDWTKDIGLLKIQTKDRFTPAKLGNSYSLTRGQDVLAIGHPFGSRFSVSKGIISGLDREITISSISYKHLIQTDAALNPGNSGGPLLNSKGEVVGLVMAVRLDGPGIGYCITIDVVKSTMKAILANPKAFPRKDPP